MKVKESSWKNDKSSTNLPKTIENNNLNCFNSRVHYIHSLLLVLIVLLLCAKYIYYLQYIGVSNYT